MINRAELIKQSVSMEDVVGLLLPTCRIRHHRIPCPVHGGKGSNMRIYKDSYYCFVCHAAGDVIRFVMDLCSLSFMDACKYIDEQFCLGIFNSSMTDAERKRIEAEQKRKRTERMVSEWCEDIRTKRMETLKDIERTVELIVRDEAPKLPWDDFSPAWCEAARLREIVREEIEVG